MPKQITLSIKESRQALKAIQSKQPTNTLRARVQMLLLIQSGVYSYQTQLSQALGYCREAINDWIKYYRTGGISHLLTDHRGGNKQAAINNELFTKLSAKLADPTSGITGYKELHHFIQQEGVEISYAAMYKYIRHHFKARLKVGRKSNIKKDEAAVAVFKKPT